LRSTSLYNAPMQTTSPRKLFSTETWVFLCFVTFLGFLTFFYRYQEPARVFWDENYHIASAQKYLNGVFFMEQHPPLGKLLIALGEKIFHPNENTDAYITTDYATKIPDTFSYVGYRFFSALLGWWTVPIFFLILLLITRNGLFAALLSFFYIFDNALIVHMRGAMLEGPLMFFCALVVLSFFLLLEYHHDRRSLTWLSLLFGASFGLALTTKLFSLILILLLPALLLKFLPNWKKILKCTGLFLVGFAVVYITVWQIHFSLGSRIVSQLPDDG
jgi:dolichyl-phosphate-mannose-protein mannosyltransferase